MTAIMTQFSNYKYTMKRLKVRCACHDMEEKHLCSSDCPDVEPYTGLKSIISWQ